MTTPATLPPIPPARPSDRAVTPGAAERLIAELTAESETTRRVLERVPEDHLPWRPHPKSMALGQLALHLARLPLGITALVEALRVEVPTVPLPEPATRDELLDALAGSVAHAAGRIAAWGDDGLAAPWTLTRDGAPLVTMPRGAVLRSLLLNHSYHHRGQLTVYLRLLDVPVPPVYGPTADERPFG